jgi:SAM-dependent methyltransferase
MKPDSIYDDGTYAEHNPTLHEEDSSYKMRYLAELLEETGGAWPPHVRILDVGGGAGVLGRLVCEWFVLRGHDVTCVAVDVSADMLARQRRNNPYLQATHLGDLATLRGGGFDLALAIDVVEHLEVPDEFARRLNDVTRFVLYNIPTERNLSDWLRNVCLRGRYYDAQRACLGHLHFFSPAAAKAFVRRHHVLLAARFPAFARHVLETNHPSYDVQRQHRLRRLELTLSAAIRDVLGHAAAWLIQGSFFMLARARPS